MVQSVSSGQVVGGRSPRSSRASCVRERCAGEEGDGARSHPELQMYCWSLGAAKERPQRTRGGWSNDGRQVATCLAPSNTKKQSRVARKCVLVGNPFNEEMACCRWTGRVGRDTRSGVRLKPGLVRHSLPYGLLQSLKQYDSGQQRDSSAHASEQCPHMYTPCTVILRTPNPRWSVRLSTSPVITLHQS